MSSILMDQLGDMTASFHDLGQIQVPPETRTFKPVPHDHLVTKMIEVSSDIFTDYTMVGEHYALAREGQRLFAVLNFQHKEIPDMALSLAARSSYDKSMSLAFAAGATIFICTNLALQGDIVEMKKHSPKNMDNIEDTVLRMTYKSMKSFKQINTDAHFLQQVPMSNERGFEMLGKLYGEGLLTPRQLPVVKDKWLRPDYECFQARNAWSFYNSVNEGLKSTPPNKVMEKHIDLHRVMMDQAVSIPEFTLP